MNMMAAEAEWPTLTTFDPTIKPEFKSVWI
jgi:hypothetical protein